MIYLLRKIIQYLKALSNFAILACFFISLKNKFLDENDDFNELMGFVIMILASDFI